MQRVNILEALYYGNISPVAKCFDRSSAYAECMEAISESEEKLFASLGEGEQQLLTRFIEAQSRVLCFSEVEHFVEGFRLGAEFMLDTFLLPRKSVVKDIAV